MSRHSAKAFLRSKGSDVTRHLQAFIYHGDTWALDRARIAARAYEYFAAEEAICSMLRSQPKEKWPATCAQILAEHFPEDV